MMAVLVFLKMEPIVMFKRQMHAVVQQNTAIVPSVLCVISLKD